MHEAKDVAIELARRAKPYVRDPRMQIVLGIVGVLFLITLTVHRFSPKEESLRCAFRMAQGAAPVTEGDAHRVDTCVELEVASTNSARTLGLSGRRSMPRNHGMLFDFKVADQYCMWMKDMHI